MARRQHGERSFFRIASIPAWFAVLIWPAAFLQAADPSIGIDDPRHLEGHSGTSDLVFTLTLSAPHTLPVMVDYATSDGSATETEDYLAMTGTVTFPAGETQRTVAVQVFGDTVFEPNEYLRLTLSNPVNATIADDTGLGWIDNDDVRLFVNDVSAVEGNAGTTDYVFTVSLSNVYDLPVSVDFATRDGTAAAPDDYVPVSGTLAFDPGQLQKTVTVPVNGDTEHEDLEWFFLDLFNPVNAGLGAGSGLGVIQNDDVLVFLSGDVTLEEGNSGFTDFPFTVSLSAPYVLPVSVDYATIDGSAAAPGDFLETMGTVNIPAGETEQVIVVPVAGDTGFEPDESFTLVLSGPVNASLGTAAATGSILNDDVLISISDAQRNEGLGSPQMVFSITLSGPYELPVSVDFATSDGTAIAPLDYIYSAGTVTFPAGVTLQQISVQLVGDEAKEPDEDFLVTLSNPANADIGDGIAVGTILNDDITPGLFIGGVVQVEGNSGTTDFAFPVALSAPSEQEIQAGYITVEASALAPEDFLATSGTLIIPAGETAAAIHVPVVGDGDVETDETFKVLLSAPVHAIIAVGTAFGTIVNDDFPNEISIDDVAAAEGDDGTTDFIFTVSLDSSGPGTVEVAWATADGAAAANDDYLPSSGTVTFPPGETVRTLAVPVVGDTVDECQEDFLVVLSDPVNGTIIDGTGIGTILNDDALACANADGDCFHDITCGGRDCADGDPFTYPGAPEVNDGIDNQCPGDGYGFGVVDEITGPVGFSNPADLSEISWTPQSGATLYEVVRSTAPHFASGCVSLGMTAVPWMTDPEFPLPGRAFYYLGRPAGVFTGSWGQDWTGAERSFVCPGP